jgi:hypothetical protein
MKPLTGIDDYIIVKASAVKFRRVVMAISTMTVIVSFLVTSMCVHNMIELRSAMRDVQQLHEDSRHLLSLQNEAVSRMESLAVAQEKDIQLINTVAEYIREKNTMIGFNIMGNENGGGSWK